jgi:hypothetical protein
MMSKTFSTLKFKWISVNPRPKVKGIVNLAKTCWYMICVVLGGRWSNNVNEDVNLFKTKVSDMPFRARQLTEAWPHIGITHGGAPWWCGKVPSWRVGVQLPNLSNGFGPRGCKRRSKGFLSGTLDELSAHPLCEGVVGKGFPLAHALEGKG